MWADGVGAYFLACVGMKLRFTHRGDDTGVAMTNTHRQARHRRSAIAAVFIAALLAGCAVTPGSQIAAPEGACTIRGSEPLPSADTYRHLVVADDHGRPAYKEDMRARVVALLDEHWAKGDRKLLVYVHGGLNSERAIVRDPDLPRILRAMSNDGYVPLLLLWRSGGWETWWEQVSRVRGGQRFERTVWDTPVYVATDLAQGVVRAPVTYIKQIGRFTDSYTEAREHGWKIDGEKGRYAGEGKKTGNLIFHNYVDNGHTKFSDQASYALTFPARMLLSPFVDSLGTTAWENMVRRARTTIHQTAEFDPACLTPASDVFKALAQEPRGSGAFVSLFAAIEKWREEKDPHREMTITLIGHSMGTIILSDLVRLFPDLPFTDIVYMGAAVSIGEFNRSVVPYLRNSGIARFYNLMLHPQLEAMELTAGGAVPSGSLLEWIDEMYEPPRTMLDRTLGKWRNVRMARGIWPEAVAHKMVFKVFGQGPGEPDKHGAFNDAAKCFWNPGFWAIPVRRKAEEGDPWGVQAFDWSWRGVGAPRAIDQCFEELPKVQTQF